MSRHKITNEWLEQLLDANVTVSTTHASRYSKPKPKSKKKLTEWKVEIVPREKWKMKGKERSSLVPQIIRAAREEEEHQVHFVRYYSDTPWPKLNGEKTPEEFKAFDERLRRFKDGLRKTIYAPGTSGGKRDGFEIASLPPVKEVLDLYKTFGPRGTVANWIHWYGVLNTKSGAPNSTAGREYLGLPHYWLSVDEQVRRIKEIYPQEKVELLCKGGYSPRDLGLPTVWELQKKHKKLWKSITRRDRPTRRHIVPKQGLKDFLRKVVYPNHPMLYHWLSAWNHRCKINIPEERDFLYQRYEANESLNPDHLKLNPGKEHQRAATNLRFLAKEWEMSPLHVASEITKLRYNEVVYSGSKGSQEVVFLPELMTLCALAWSRVLGVKFGPLDNNGMLTIDRPQTQYTYDFSKTGYADVRIGDSETVEVKTGFVPFQEERLKDILDKYAFGNPIWNDGSFSKLERTLVALHMKPELINGSRDKLESHGVHTMGYVEFREILERVVQGIRSNYMDQFNSASPRLHDPESLLWLYDQFALRPLTFLKAGHRDLRESTIQVLRNLAQRGLEISQGTHLPLVNTYEGLAQLLNGNIVKSKNGTNLIVVEQSLSQSRAPAVEKFVKIYDRSFEDIHVFKGIPQSEVVFFDFEGGNRLRDPLVTVAFTDLRHGEPRTRVVISPDYTSEEALIRHTLDTLNDYASLVSWNGEWDLRKLTERARQHGIFASREHYRPFDEVLQPKHYDVYHRKFRQNRKDRAPEDPLLAKGGLKTFEEEALGFHRSLDTLGEKVPDIYQGYLNGDSQMPQHFAGIVNHNMWDSQSVYPALLYAHLSREERAHWLRERVPKTLA